MRGGIDLDHQLALLDHPLELLLGVPAQPEPQLELLLHVDHHGLSAAPPAAAVEPVAAQELVGRARGDAAADLLEDLALDGEPAPRLDGVRALAAALRQRPAGEEDLLAEVLDVVLQLELAERALTGAEEVVHPDQVVEPFLLRHHRLVADLGGPHLGIEGEAQGMAETVARPQVQELDHLVDRPQTGEQMPEVLADVVGQAEAAFLQQRQHLTLAAQMGSQGARGLHLDRQVEKKSKSRGEHLGRGGELLGGIDPGDERHHLVGLAQQPEQPEGLAPHAVADEAIAREGEAPVAVGRAGRGVTLLFEVEDDAEPGKRFRSRPFPHVPLAPRPIPGTAGSGSGRAGPGQAGSCAATPASRCDPCNAGSRV